MRIVNKIPKIVILLLGTVCLTFAGLNWQIAICAWMAPVFLLLYTRRARTGGFFLFFLFTSVAGFISQTNNNVFNEPIFHVINGVTSGIVFTGFYLLDRWLYKKGKGFYSTLIFPSLFTVLEFLFSTLIGSSGVIGQSQIAFAPFIQISTVVGLPGITFLVLWFAAIVNWMLENDLKKPFVKKGLLVYALIFVPVLIFGLIRMTTYPEAKKTVKVATISGLFDLHGFARAEKESLNQLMKNKNMEIPNRIFADEELLKKQMAHTKEAAQNGAKIIVWNEDAVLVTPVQVDNLIEQTKVISEAFDAYILMAFLVKNTGLLPQPFNNKSKMITPDGEIAWEYRKSYPAPAEIPLINRGNSVIPYLDSDYGRIGNVICYDLDFPNYLRQAGKNKIDIMLVPAYDWEEYAQLHSKMARLEALQSGHSIIRANGAGINLVADSRGKTITESNTFTTDAKIMYADLPLHSTRTVYARIGNVFVWLPFLFLVFLIGSRIFRKRKK